MVQNKLDVLFKKPFFEKELAKTKETWGLVTNYRLSKNVSLEKASSVVQ